MNVTRARAAAAAGNSSFVPTRLGRLHVRTHGQGPLTVLWPSMFVDGHTWDGLVDRLAPARRRLVLVDGPGLGLSDPLARDSDIAEAADAAVDLLDGLGADGPVDWVGNAFGGHVGFDLATRPGVLRSLVAISSPAEPIAVELRRQINMMLPLLRVAGPVGPVRAAIIEAMLTEASAGDASVLKVVTDSLARPSRRSITRAVRSFILNRVDVTDQLRDNTVPSLFVASDDRGDWSPEDAERAARITPHAEAVVIPGARTLVPLEQPAATARTITDFWQQVEQS